MAAFKILAIGIALLSVVIADPILKAESVGSEKSLTREKRQIPVQTLPTFPPDVERTADGVPILDERYLARTDRPAARFFAQFEPTTESEGLRLYEGLWATGGRNEPRSLDHSDPFGDNGIQPHHRQSAAWSTRKETKRFSSSRSGRKIQVRSGGSDHDQEDLPVPLLPSGFGPSTGPKFSEEVTYRRSSGGSNNNGNLQTRSLTSTRNGENGFTCVTCRRSSSNSGTGGASPSSSHQLRSLGHASEEISGAHAETEGLRLYNKWLSESQSKHGSSSRRNRNQLRTLDNGAGTDDLLDETTSTNGNSRNSASSWSKREERRSSRRSSKTITVRSGGTGSSDLPVPILPAVIPETTTPRFSEEVTYRRSAGGSSSSGNSGTQTRSLISTSRRNDNNGESGFTCVTCRRSSAPTAVSATTGSRSEVRSLDLNQAETVGQHATFPISSPNVQTHHSESWSENEERRHHNSRSSSSSSVPINGGEVRVTDLENRADIAPVDESEEVTYRRASSGSSGSGGCAISNGASSHTSSSSSSATNNGSVRRTNCTRISSNSRTNGQSSATAAETRNLSSASGATGNSVSGSGCRRCVTQTSSSLRTSDNEGSSASASYRSSRVPSATSSRTTTRALDYPPVQTFGHGEGQVAARVLHSDDDSEFSQHASSASENGAENSEAASQTGSSDSKSGKKFKKAYYRRTVFKNYTTSAFPASLETWLGA